MTPSAQREDGYWMFAYGVIVGIFLGCVIIELCR